MVREEIFSHLRNLKLSGMLAVYDEVLEEGRRSRSTADKTLLRLLTAEVAERRAKSHNYRLGQARFPSVKDMDSFDFADTPINEAQVHHLHEGEEEHMHTHVLEDGTTVMHSHGEHGHHHSHAQTKAVLNRLSRAIGHLESIKRMVEDGRDCSEVLIQLSAVKSAINNTGKIILQDHIEHCIVDAVEHGDKDAIKELERAIDRFMK